MPYIGIGLHVLAAIYFAVRAIRSGQSLYWLILLFSFPLLGSVVYFLAIYFPEARNSRGARQAIRSAKQLMDPGQDLRDARAEMSRAPTVVVGIQNPGCVDVVCTLPAGYGGRCVEAESLPGHPHTGFRTMHRPPPLSVAASAYTQGAQP